MTDSTLQALSQPEPQVTDPLHELLRRHGARDLIVLQSAQKRWRRSSSRAESR